MVTVGINEILRTPVEQKHTRAVQCLLLPVTELHLREHIVHIASVVVVVVVVAERRADVDAERLVAVRLHQRILHPGVEEGRIFILATDNPVGVVR